MGGKRRPFPFILCLPSEVIDPRAFLYHITLPPFRTALCCSLFLSHFLSGPNPLKGKDLIVFIFACLLVLGIVGAQLFVLHKVLAQCSFFINICGMTGQQMTCIQYCCNISLHHLKEESPIVK